MKSREFTRIHHPKIGIFVYRHRGNGLIIDNITKPLKAVAIAGAKALTTKVIKPLSKKAITAGVSHAGEKIGKMAADKGVENLVILFKKC